VRVLRVTNQGCTRTVGSVPAQVLKRQRCNGMARRLLFGDRSLYANSNALIFNARRCGWSACVSRRSETVKNCTDQQQQRDDRELAAPIRFSPRWP